MRIAIVSDIHGNCVALESVLSDLKSEHIDHIVCLGDVATDGPQPCEVIAQLKTHLGLTTQIFHRGNFQKKNSRNTSEIQNLESIWMCMAT